MAIKYVSPEGLEKLKTELHQLRTKGRADIANQISEAREKGDLSENAEYDAAKEAQGHLERKIAQLEEELGNCRLLDESKVDNSKVMILSKVKIKNLKLNKEIDYTIVSDSEADVKSGKISINTPIAQGLMGKEVGTIIDIAIPAGIMQVQILEISR
jgi:transcription elongation factor GreA